MSKAKWVALIAAVLLITCILATQPEASAQAGLRAQVYLTQAKIPRGSSERALLGFARRAKSLRLRETAGGAIPARKWLAEMITSFNRAPGDLEFHVLF